MIHHGSVYSNHIIDCTICYPIVMVSSQSTVPDYLALTMRISGKLIGSVFTNTCGVALHWSSYTLGLPLKLELVHDGLFRCE